MPQLLMDRIKPYPSSLFILFKIGGEIYAAFNEGITETTATVIFPGE